jgi:hypothetical protein
MVLYLDENESFSISGYVESPGYQRIGVSGYLVQHRGDGTYVAPLIPQLFYGNNGSQLQTWRQEFTTTGDQVILSRSGGYPKVPREELYWRKVSNGTVKKEEVTVALTPAIPSWAIPVGIIGAVAVAYILYRAVKH